MVITQQVSLKILTALTLWFHFDISSFDEANILGDVASHLEQSRRLIICFLSKNGRNIGRTGTEKKGRAT